MGSYTFRWPYNANEVFVTGTFDDWGKTVKLDPKGDIFEKPVHFPTADEKVYYKFVVDGIWTTDSGSPEEDDGSRNINNVLYPHQIKSESHTTQLNGAVMSGVTPDSTTAALAAGVPKESEKRAPGETFLSAAPTATTAELAKGVPLEYKAGAPGTFPETPAEEAEQQFSVNPIPASGGIGNPIKLKPGEKVPDHSTFTDNTVQSTVRTDLAGYEQDASASLPGGQSKSQDVNDLAVPPVSKNMIPESSLPMGGAGLVYSDPGITVQSAGPTSTTAALAAAVPLESQRTQTNGPTPAHDVPEVVKHSLAEAHKDPEAAANEEAVEEKKEVEEELKMKTHLDEHTGTPAPTTTAATTETAPKATDVIQDSSQVSPKTITPTGPSPTGPTVTTGVASATAPEVSGEAATGTTGMPSSIGVSEPSKTVETSTPATTTAGGAATQGQKPTNGQTNGSKSDQKKKKGFWSRLKEKLNRKVV